MSQPMKRLREDEDDELTMSSVHSSITNVSVESSELTEDSSRRDDDVDEFTKSSLDSSATGKTEDSSRHDDDVDELSKSSVNSLATEVLSSTTETPVKRVICNPFSDVRNSYIFSHSQND